MRRLRISDLSFCEIEVTNVLVRGGGGNSLSINGPYGSASAQVAYDYSSGYNTGYSVDPKNGYTAYITASYNGVAASAVAGAAGDGYNFAYASASASSG